MKVVESFYNNEMSLNITMQCLTKGFLGES